MLVNGYYNAPQINFRGTNPAIKGVKSALDNTQIVEIEKKFLNALDNLQKAGESFTVGRSKKNATVQVNHASVSNQHASIFRREKNGTTIYTITDNNSTNGTMVNGRKLTANQAVEINPHYNIQLGNAQFSVPEFKKSSPAFFKADDDGTILGTHMAEQGTMLGAHIKVADTMLNPNPHATAGADDATMLPNGVASDIDATVLGSPIANARKAVVVSADEIQQKLKALRHNELLYIGSGHSNGLKIFDGAIEAHHHAFITRGSGSTFSLTSNYAGTTIKETNGNEIAIGVERKTQIRPGDTILIGNSEVKIPSNLNF